MYNLFDKLKSNSCLMFGVICLKEFYQKFDYDGNCCNVAQSPV